MLISFAGPSPTLFCEKDGAPALKSTGHSLQLRKIRYPPQSSGPVMDPGMGKLFTASMVF